MLTNSLREIALHKQTNKVTLFDKTLEWSLLPPSVQCVLYRLRTSFPKCLHKIVAVISQLVYS